MCDVVKSDSLEPHRVEILREIEQLVADNGSVSVSTFQGNDGTTRASLEVTADDVEFLSPKGEGMMPGSEQSAPAGGYGAVGTPPQGSGFVQVDDEELPF